jgi:replication factor A1
MTNERRRYDGTWNKQAECIVGDQYGCAKLVVKNEQLDVIKEGATITVRNCHAKVVKEHLRLEVDKWGKIIPSTEKVDKVNLSNNLSDVEYELV